MEGCATVITAQKLRAPPPLDETKIDGKAHRRPVESVRGNNIQAKGAD